MRYFKDAKDGFYAVLSDDVISSLPAGAVEITETEFQALNPPSPEAVATAAQVAKNAQDITAAKSYGKLTALKGMSPAQVQAWVSANVTNLAQAQDAIATLAIGVGVLARSL